MTEPSPSPENFNSLTGFDPAQLDFLEIFKIERSPWTRGIAFYDTIPKFVFSSDKKSRLKTPQARKTDFIFDGVPYSVIRLPAQIVIRNKAGTITDTFFRWPGECAELVSRALRYLAVQNLAPISFWQHQKQPNISPQLRVAFTLNQISALLKKWGHSFNTKEVHSALEMLVGSILTVERQGEEVPGSKQGIISHYVYPSQNGSRVRYVILNAIESDAILRGDHRAVNFMRLMSLRSPLARRIYELLMLRFINADKPPKQDDAFSSLPNPFKLRLSRMIEEGVIDPSPQFDRTVKRFRTAIQELAEAGILWKNKPFHEQIDKQKTTGRHRIVDAMWSVWLSAEAVSDVIAANKEAVGGQDKILMALPPVKRAQLRKKGKEELPYAGSNIFE